MEAEGRWGYWEEKKEEKLQSGYKKKEKKQMTNKYMSINSMLLIIKKVRIKAITDVTSYLPVAISKKSKSRC